MVERLRVYGNKFKFVGVFDLNAFYNFVYMWLQENKYVIIEEKGYTEKIKPNGKEVEIHWECRKKVSDYFRFMLKLDWLVLGMTTVEVEENGQKIKMNKGSLEIIFTGYLEKDYEHRWETSAVSKFLRGLYDRYVVRGVIEQYEEQVMMEVDEVNAQCKSYLSLEGRK
jgi:hypothetical protein